MAPYTPPALTSIEVKAIVLTHDIRVLDNPLNSILRWQMPELHVESPWMQALVIVVLTLLLNVVAQMVLRFVLIPLARKTKSDLDDIIIRAVRNFLVYSIPLVGLMVALTPFSLKTLVPRHILTSLLIVVLMRILIVLTEDVSCWLEKIWVAATESSLDVGLLPLVRRATKTIVVIVGVLVILGEWNIEIAPMLGALGIGGLAIGLALNTSLANVFGGIQLILDRSIRVGEKIMLESGEVGVVLDIGLRSTKLRSYDNEVIYIPNSYLANARIKNYTKPDATIRVTVTFSVAYGSDITEVKNVVTEAISGLNGILKEPGPQVLFLNMGDFSLDMSARVWVGDYDKQFAKKLEMVELIYNTLNENNIEIPFPTRTVFMKQDS